MQPGCAALAVPACCSWASAGLDNTRAVPYEPAIDRITRPRTAAEATTARVPPMNPAVWQGGLPHLLLAAQFPQYGGKGGGKGGAAAEAAAGVSGRGKGKGGKAADADARRGKGGGGGGRGRGARRRRRAARPTTGRRQLRRRRGRPPGRPCRRGAAAVAGAGCCRAGSVGDRPRRRRQRRRRRRTRPRSPSTPHCCRQRATIASRARREGASFSLCVRSSLIPAIVKSESGRALDLRPRGAPPTCRASRNLRNRIRNSGVL